jgi:hypothetical protein
MRLQQQMRIHLTCWWRVGVDVVGCYRLSHFENEHRHPAAPTDPEGQDTMSGGATPMQGEQHRGAKRADLFAHSRLTGTGEQIASMVRDKVRE